MATEDKEHKDKDNITVSGNNITISGNISGSGIAIGHGATVSIFSGKTDATNRQELRHWWHSILADQGRRFACYAIFLVLPADKEAVRYLREFGNELNLISGENCLVLALTDRTIINKEFKEAAWSDAIKEHIDAGYSVRIAEHFNINLTEFPCVIFFEDIRSPIHLLVPLKNMTAEQIIDKMRRIFSRVHDGISKKENALLSIKAQQSIDTLNNTGKAITQGVRSVAGKTFETALQTFVEVIVKSSSAP